MTLMRTRCDLYAAARLLGDINAAKRGPTAMLKRVLRKLVGRQYGSVVGRVLR